jgi:hypothetical protein
MKFGSAAKRQKPGIHGNPGRILKWTGPGLNRRHTDFQSRSRRPMKPHQLLTRRYANDAESATGSAQQKAQQFDPELAKIIAAWPSLPAAIRRAMLALIG